MEKMLTKNQVIGKKVVELFNLKKVKSKEKEDTENKYITAWGVKSLEGIGETIKSIVKDV